MSCVNKIIFWGQRRRLNLGWLIVKMQCLHVEIYLSFTAIYVYFASMLFWQKWIWTVSNTACRFDKRNEVFSSRYNMLITERSLQKKPSMQIDIFTFSVYSPYVCIGYTCVCDVHCSITRQTWLRRRIYEHK